MIAATGSASAAPALRTASSIVEHTPERNSIYYAYFEPYSHERHLDLLGRVEMSPLRLGQQSRCHRGRA
jgi:murein tripeptide amidase MpaA